ncbi:MAG: hypothetical protein KDC54_17520 [Lewinella sp.]|nr:hypothetical protein [Lewinella sp.]
MPITKTIAILSIIALSLASCQPQQEAYTAYLFAYFTGNGPGEEQVRYAVSRDGYHYRALVVIRSTHEAGEIKLTVSTPDLPDAGIILAADLE